MKLSEKLSELAQSTADPQELVEKCREAGIIISTEQAQKLIDTHEMTEVCEDDLGTVTGGNYFGCTCSTCGRADKLEIDVRADHSVIICARCQKSWTPDGQEFILEEAIIGCGQHVGSAKRKAFLP